MDILDDKELEYVIFSSVCMYCKHLDLDKWKNTLPGETQTCKAFNKIPDEIWEGINNHTEPYPGDNGVQFERIKMIK